MKNMKILIGLMLAILAMVLLSGCVQRIPEQTETPQGEIQARISEISAMAGDFSTLSDSVAELDESEDLLKVFQGD